MRITQFVCASVVAVGVLTAPATASAQDAQVLRQEIDQLRRDFETLKQQYGDRLSALETKLATTEGAAPATPPAAPPVQATPPAAAAAAQVPAGAEGAGGPSGSLPVYGNAAAGSKVFNPDIAVIGDFLGAVGKNDLHPDPFGPGDHPGTLQLHESEASFQAVIDPYARGDFFISFGESGVEIEEGYVTFTSLPGGLLAKVGKMRAAFGKVNATHNHVLPWTDRPLVTNNLVGGEDGISDAGLSVAKLISNPWVFLEATGQIFRGDSGPDEQPLFRTAKRSDVSYVGHVRAYHDLSEDSNIDLGFSYARGHNTAGELNNENPSEFTTNLYGIDATMRWRPLQRSIYHSFVGRTEWIWSRRDQLNGLQSSNGMYVSGDYQFARRWFGGARYDRSYRADDASLLDTGGSLLLTFWPSEFSQVRGQYRHISYALGESANELLFQFQFSIGAHGAHPF
jgi:hypothetical protein